MKGALIPLAALALAACSGGEPAADEGTAAGEPSRFAETYAQPLSAPEGDAELTPLVADAAVKAGLGDGACTFAYMDRPLLVAGGGKAVAVLDGRELALTGNGGEFAGDGATFTVASAPGGDADAAALVVAASGGETRFSPGTWSCAS